MTRVEKIKEEIATNYYCNGDEEESVQLLTDDLNKFEKEIVLETLKNVYRDYCDACKKDRLARENGDIFPKYVNNFWNKIKEQIKERK